ncbi:MAG: LamG domain-containing protein [Phycisphaerales bacterium]|nr:MAG: LamG domain-containing protein [Phycisphaerales bacterium]
MFNKLIWLVVLFSLFVPATRVSADLIGHWPLDGNADDVSGNGNDGAAGGGVTYTEGVSGLAADFNGSNALINCGDIPVGDTGAISIAFWVKPRNIAQNWAGFVSKWTLDNSQRTFWLGQHSTDGWLRFGYYPGGPAAETYVDSGQIILANDQWTHIVCTHDGDIQRIHADGVEIVASPSRNAGIIDRGGNLRFGIVAAANWFNGLLDDIRIYDHALSEGEILGAMEGKPWPYALGPEPADGALLQATWTTLKWKPGDLAVSHDVYLGDDLDEVSQATRDSAVFHGNQTVDFLVVGFPGFAYPEGLVPGTTYYWRIDEVNDADPNSPWKGDVWSFWLPSKIAYDPNPSNGAMFVGSDADLSWTAGWGGVMHATYFGTDAQEVANASGGAAQTETMFDPGALTPGTTYYWRVDEFNGMEWLKGDVWSFTTVPDIAITDPNLVGWWQLDEGVGTTAVDSSGRGNHGTVLGGARWAGGYHGGALDFDGVDDFVDMGNPPGLPSGAAPRSVCAWATTDNLAGGWKVIVGYGSPAGSQSNGFARNGTRLSGFGYGNDLLVYDFWQTELWYHLCLTYDGTTAILYVNGEQVLSEAKEWNLNLSRARIGRQVNDAAEFWDGLIDDVRIYNKVLTPEEITLVMRGDPLLAWSPSPADGSTPDVDTALPLSWLPGDIAAQHDVYFGIDADAVKAADASDTTGVYRGRQSTTSFTPAEGVEWGAGPFYWRVDENNTDGTVTKGRVWTFMVADFILVDDFESYDDIDPAPGEPGINRIFDKWIDGYGIATNGSQVGNLMPPYAEQTIVHGGNQSMPLFYDNTGGVRNSQAELKLVAPRDWTRHGVSRLSLWFRGYPPSVGSFTEGPVGTFTLTAAGADVWGTADQFHFAYKTLTGPGSIIARVDSVQNTHPWAKAGVMIRETLDPGSKHAFAVVSGASGVAFQGRTDTGSSSFGTTEAGIAAPHWVKVERDVGGNFTVTHSTNGSSWVPVGDAVPMNIPMTSNVYVGLALASHDATTTCQAKFSNVTTAGTVGQQWMSQDIGILGNDPEPLYVALSNAGSAPVVVVHDDPGAVTIDTWTQWPIDLQLFADKGINLADVDKIAIGLGAQGDPAATGGSGTLFLDDIRLLRPIEGTQP